MKQPFFIR